MLFWTAGCGRPWNCPGNASVERYGILNSSGEKGYGGDMAQEKIFETSEVKIN